MDERQRECINQVIRFRDDMRAYAVRLEKGHRADDIRDRMMPQAGLMQRLCERINGVWVKPPPFFRGPAANVWTLALFPSPGFDQAEMAADVADHLTMVIGHLEADPSLLDPPPPQPTPQPEGVQTVHIHGAGTVNFAQTQSGDVTQTNTFGADIATVRQLLGELTAAIAALDAPEEERDGFLAPVETVKAELRQPRPIVGRLLPAYGAIQAFATAESTWQGWERVQRIAEALGPHLRQVIEAIPK